MTRHTYQRNHSHPIGRKIAQIKHRAWMAVSAIVLITCGLLGFLGTIGSAILLYSTRHTSYEIVETSHPFYAGSPMGPDAAVSPLSEAFTPEVQYWAPLIKAWAVMYQIDPNLIATVIQIESCGDPQVSSPAGAQGLFQVMPFNFDPGDDMLDVQTNARQGLTYLAGSLDRADGHAGLALAGYNGGHGVIQGGWATWTNETRRYYYWGSRIYAEAVSGMKTSPTLQEWLDAGGSSLCTQASESEKQLDEQQARLLSLSTN
jgi:hypothetical protein